MGFSPNAYLKSWYLKVKWNHKMAAYLPEVCTVLSAIKGDKNCRNIIKYASVNLRVALEATERRVFNDGKNCISLPPTPPVILSLPTLSYPSVLHQMGPPLSTLTFPSPSNRTSLAPFSPQTNRVKYWHGGRINRQCLVSVADTWLYVYRSFTYAGYVLCGVVSKYW